jgi:hypothetical protein
LVFIHALKVEIIRFKCNREVKKTGNPLDYLAEAGAFFHSLSI